MLKDAGAEMIRDKKHYRFRLANGKTLTLAKAPGDYRSVLNTISDLRRLMV